jgi:hypothetical protein
MCLFFTEHTQHLGHIPLSGQFWICCISSWLVGGVGLACGVVFGQSTLPPSYNSFLNKASLKSLWYNLELQEARRMKLFSITRSRRWKNSWPSISRSTCWWNKCLSRGQSCPHTPCVCYSLVLCQVWVVSMLITEITFCWRTVLILQHVLWPFCSSILWLSSYHSP